MSTLVVAFDGLDHELIKRFELESIQRGEFGEINNSTNISARVTDELFASFITGETWEEHGVVGLRRPESEILARIEKLRTLYLFRKFNGLRHNLYASLPFLGGTREYSKPDLDSSTFFEKVPNSKDIDVPSYSLGYRYLIVDVLDECGLEPALEELERFTRWKKDELFDSMEADFDLVMAHFHKADHVHHWFWEVGKMDKVEETYHELDEMAAEIKEKAEKEGFDTVLFMSDHGLPDVENGGHNENAFYSCNRELFGDGIPHITDFHDKIIELTSGSELDGVQV